MRKETEIKLELDKFEIIEANLDDDFALCKLYICSDGRNLHDINISLEAIIKAQETLKNKYLVAQINAENHDFMGHEWTEKIIGHFPESSKMEIVQYKNRNFLTAQALISKVYASEDYFILSKGNHKGVSMEIKNVKWSEDWETIEDFSFHGVTVLGDNRTPAIPDANIEIMVFESNKHYNDYLNPDNKSGFFNNKKFNKKEVNMAKNEKFEDKVEEEDDNKTSMSTEDETEQDDVTENETADTTKDTETENDKMSYEDLEKENELLKGENTALKSEVASFKSEKFETKVKNILFAIKEKIPNFPQAKLDEFREESKKYSLETVINFENLCKANAFEVSVEQGIEMKKDGIGKMARSQNVNFTKKVDSKADPNIYG